MLPEENMVSKLTVLAYTAEVQGKQVLFKCSDNSSLLTEDWLEAISFLLKPCDYGVCWNIDHFTEVFCSLIPQKTASELREKGRIYLPMPYRQKLYWQPGRVFSITWGQGREINFYSLSRYSDKEAKDIDSLVELSKKVIGAYSAFGLEPKRLTSPVAVYGEVLNKLDFPRACDLPDSALPLLNKCSEVAWEEWRDVFKLGHWGANEITDYDLSSAYPWLISMLPDLRGAKFFGSDTMPEKGEYSWGELEGQLKIDKDVTPFGFVGEKNTQITTEHLWLINQHKLGEFVMKHGWFFKLPKNYKTPFKQTMMDLYKARQNGNSVVSKIAKAISVGIGGKFAQRYDTGELGEDYNSIYARMITSRCGIKVADLIHRNNLTQDVVSILVDGCLIQGKKIELCEKQGMGAWRINPPSPFLIASLLYQWGAEKKPNKQTYSEVMDSIKKNPNSPIIGKDVDLNLLTYDRIFDELPKRGADLITKRFTSKPQSK